MALLKSYVVDEVINLHTNEKKEVIIEETMKGLLVTDKIKNSFNNIGKFFLRLVGKDENTNIDNEKITDRKYWFDIYVIKSNKIIKSDMKFCYTDGETFRSKVSKRFPDGIFLKSHNRDCLKYLELYIRHIVNIELNKRVPKFKIEKENENKELVRNYMKYFMELIHGQEDIYIENGFDELYRTNKTYCEDNTIRNNKDLFLTKRQEDANYNKIGYVKNKEGTNIPLYYFLHIPAIKQLMEIKERFPEKISTQVLNIGLRGLKIITLPEGRNVQNYKSTDGKKSMNLTKLSVEELNKLIEITEEPDKHEHEIEYFENGCHYNLDTNTFYVNPNKTNISKKSSFKVIGERPTVEENIQETATNQQNLDDSESYIALISNVGVVIYNKFINEIIQRIPNLSSKTIQELTDEYQGKEYIVKTADTEEEKTFIQKEMKKYYQEQSENSIISRYYNIMGGSY